MRVVTCFFHMETIMVRTKKQAAAELGVEPHQIDYAMRKGYFQANVRNMLGSAYGFDDDDMAELRQALEKIQKRARRRSGRLKYAVDKSARKKAPPAPKD